MAIGRNILGLKKTRQNLLGDRMAVRNFAKDMAGNAIENIANKILKLETTTNFTEKTISSSWILGIGHENL